MRTREQQLLGAPSVVFLSGTMTHPLFYEELLDGLSRAGFNVVGMHFQGTWEKPAREPIVFVQ